MSQDQRRFLHTQQAKVVFKGVGQEVQVILDPLAPFAELEHELEEHLERSGRFFAGAAVTLVLGGRQLRDEQVQTIRRLLTAYDLAIGEIRTSLMDNAPPTPPKPAARPLASATMPSAQPAKRYDERLRAGDMARNNALLVRGPLRSGQRLYAEDNLVVIGDVNPGAELIAGGDIVVMGVLRGVAHAGVPDHSEAIIAALSLKPTQLRIGHFISRSPELQEKYDSGPEIARVDADQIVVDSFHRRFLGAS